MNVLRLRDVIKRLKKVPPTEFDLRRFFTHKEVNGKRCRTAACVIGWCCDWYPNEFTKVYEYRNSLYYGVKHNGEYNFDAAAEWFGITYAQAVDLFDVTYYGTATPTIQDVVQAMEHFIETGETPKDNLCGD